MNADRRKRLGEIIGKIEKAAAAASNLSNDIQEMRDEIETIKDEEQEAYDNMPEGLQGGEKGERSQEIVSALEAQAERLEEFIDLLDGWSDITAEIQNCRD